MVTLEQIPVSLGNADELRRAARSLDIPLNLLYPDLDSFAEALPSIWLDIEKSGIFRPEYAEILPPNGQESHLDARVHVTTQRPNYSFGIQVNQRGDPSVDMSVTYPWLTYKPVLFSANLARSLNLSKTFSAEIVVPRLFDKNLALKVRAFSLVSDYATSNGLYEFTKGVSVGFFGKRHSLELINAMRDIDIGFVSSSVKLGSVQQSQLKSQRVSLKHSYSFQKLNFLRSNPTVPVRGVDFKTVLDIPLLFGDSENVRLHGILSVYRRIIPSLVNRFYCKGGVAVDIPGFSEYNTNISQVSDSPRHGVTRAPSQQLPLMDRFFIGGVNDPSTSFHGYKDRSIPADSQDHSGGASGFFLCGTSLSIDLPFIPIPQLRGFCFAQTGVIVRQLQPNDLFRESMVRSSVGLGLCLPVGNGGKFEVTLSWPFSRDIVNTQMFQVAFTSQG